MIRYLKSSFALTAIIFLNFTLVKGQQVVANNDTVFMQPFSIDTVNVTHNDSITTGDTLCIRQVYGAPFYVYALDCNRIVLHQPGSFIGSYQCNYVACLVNAPLICDTAEVLVHVNTPAYLPLIEPGKVWHVCAWFAENPSCEYRLSFGADTVINAVSYTAVNLGFDNYTNCAVIGNDSVAGWVREDSLKRVYFFPSSNLLSCFANDTVEHLLYDFGLNKGDTMFFSNDYHVIDSVYAGVVDGIVRKMWLTGYSSGNAYCNFYQSYNNPVIEGIGSVTGLLTPVWSTFENGFVLSCATSSSNFIYGDSTCGYCGSIGINEIKQSVLNVYPNPAYDFCIMQLASMKFYDADIFDVTGRKVKAIFANQLISTYRFDITHLSPGVYFIKVAETNARPQEEGKYYFAKLIKQ